MINRFLTGNFKLFQLGRPLFSFLQRSNDYRRILYQTNLIPSLASLTKVVTHNSFQANANHRQLRSPKCITHTLQ